MILQGEDQTGTKIYSPQSAVSAYITLHGIKINYSNDSKETLN